MNAPRPSGPSLEAFFSYGFRPFFLGAAVFTALLMTVWLAFVATVLTGNTSNWLPIAGSPFAWHAHEMVFGFAGAAMAGFLLTAVPNWTGALPLSGPPLIVLFLMWLAGRVGMGLSGLLPGWLVAGLDLMFLPVLAAFAAAQLLVKPAGRNMVFLLLLAVMTAGNVLYHAATFGVLDFDPLSAARTGMLMVAIMIAIIGGRIVPAFTHNWLHIREGGQLLPRRIDRLDQASIVSIGLFAAFVVFGLPESLQGVAAGLAAALNGMRLWLWRGWSARREPIVWILHLGYAWLVVGLCLSAASAFQAGIPASLASHAFGTGAAGTMIMAVMSRASLGHTGRPLVAPPPIVGAYLLVTLASLLRVFGPLVVPGHPSAVLTLAALAWIAAFVIFAIVYAPILTMPRVHTKVARS
jgi:uncharacterized protein involved in response to NO